MNFALVSAAVLSTAYVQALNSDLTALAILAAVTGLLGTAGVLLIGYSIKRRTTQETDSLREVEERLAAELNLARFMTEPPPRPFSLAEAPFIGAVLACALSLGALIYAAVH